MEISFPFNREALAGAYETLATEALLERGIDCSRQGHHVQGVIYFACARERLTSDQMHFATELDAIIQTYARYWQAQEALHRASKRFVEADIDRQAQIVALEELFQASRAEFGRATQPDSKPQTMKNSIENLSSQLQQLPVSNFNDKLPSYSSVQNPDILPPLYFTCFGRFEVRKSGQPIPLCSSRSGQSILRYLAVQPEHSATFDILMAMLWPEDETAAAQPKLHSAISALRHSLNIGYKCNPGCGYIMCKNRVYLLNPAVVIRTDVDEFLQCYETERRTIEERVVLYEKACSLYTGPFLPEDMYDDWSFLQREHLNQVYISMCRTLTDHYLNTKSFEAAAKWARSILKVNRCDEEAHRKLMQIYAAQGRRMEALQQYQRCESLLREELGVAPLPETTIVFHQLLTSETSSTDTAKIQ